MNIHDLVHEAKIAWTGDFITHDLAREGDLKELGRRLSDEPSLGEGEFLVINRPRLKPLVLDRVEIAETLRGPSRSRFRSIREMLANPVVADLTVVLDHKGLGYIRSELEDYLQSGRPGAALRQTLRDRLHNFHRVRLARLDKSHRVLQIGKLDLGSIQGGDSLSAADIDDQGNILFKLEPTPRRPRNIAANQEPTKRKPWDITSDPEKTASGHRYIVFDPEQAAHKPQAMTATPGSERMAASGAPPPPPGSPPMGQPPPPGGGPPEEGDEGTSLKRYPSIKPNQKAVPGKPILITIDLLREDLDRETAGKPVVIDDLSPNWKEVAVQVEVMCDLIDFESKVGEIKVRRNQASVACEFKGVVKAEVSKYQSILVVVFFEYAGRTCGVARRTVTSEAMPGPKAGGKAMNFEGNGEPPDLTIRIIQPNPSRSGIQQWSLLVARKHWQVKNLPHRRDGVINLGRQAKEFAIGWRGQFESLKPGEHLRAFQSFGEELWERAPEGFRETYLALRAELGPAFTIQFITDDPYIPWELMRPKGVAGEAKPDLLLQTHPLARFIAEWEGNLKINLQRGLVTTIAPDYPKAQDKLQRAQKEAAFLKSEYEAVPIGTTLEEVVKLLEKGHGTERVGIVHFAGHGKFSAKVPNASSILLTNGSLTAGEVNRQEVELGVKDSPLVIFNACETGSNGALLETVGGWANSFLSREFGGFIAPLWAVDDGSAVEVVKELFGALIGRQAPIGEALLEIRRKHGGESPTFFAYVFYGDVNARIMGLPPALPAMPAPPDGGQRNVTGDG